MANPLGTGPRRRAPILGSDIVTRDRLIRRLEYPRPLILVIAPAGYGKTTLVADWLRRTSRPHVWFGLCDADNSLPSFMSGLLAHLEAAAPGVCHKSHGLLNSGAEVTPAALAHQLTAELALLARPLWLVLDDYHEIRDENVQNLLGEILEHQPNTLGLALISRHEPPLPLPDMRARNLVTEVRAHELRFSQDEIGQFLDLAVESELDDSQLGIINTVTEGWPVGLRMVSLAYHQHLHAALSTMTVEFGGRLAIEYLANQVLESLPPRHLDFLIRTSILEQVCAPLGAALLNDATPAMCQEILESMADSQLFVIALDVDSKWYRFHHLLREYLRRRARVELGPSGLAHLHAQAGRWLADDGQVLFAIDHAVRAGDAQLVGRIIGEHRHKMLAQGELVQLAAWQGLVPAQMAGQQPQVLMLSAWGASLRALPVEVLQQVEAVEAGCSRVSMDSQEEIELRAELDALRTQACYWSSQLEEANKAARRALATLPARCVRARGYAGIFGVGALEILTRSDEADELLAESRRFAQQNPQLNHELYVDVAAGYAYWMRGDMAKLEEVSREAIAAAETSGHAEAGCIIHSLLGIALYLTNDLSAAQHELTIAVEAPHLLPPKAHADSVAGLSATLQALGEFGAARTVAQQAIRHYQDTGHAQAAALTSAYLATINARQGRLDEVERWLALPVRARLDAPMAGFSPIALCRAEALLALGTAAAESEAEDVMALLRAHVDRWPYPRARIVVLALHALSLWRAGDEAQALDALEIAIALSAKGGAIRYLADLDYLIGPLLDRLAAQGRSRTQVTRIRRAALLFAPAVAAPSALSMASTNRGTALTATVGADVAGAGGSAPGSTPRVLTLEEALTARELEVLQMLLLDRPTNKEIARELNVTVETVKRHMNHIFQKLHVENRRQALVEARRMGILPPA